MIWIRILLMICFGRACESDGGKWVRKKLMTKKVRTDEEF